MRELEDNAQPSPIDSNDDETPSGAIEPEDTPWCEFDDSLFSPERRRVKHRLSRSQQRENNQRRIGGGAESARSTTLKPQECDITAAELQELQEEDVTLEAVRSVAAGDPSLAGDDFFTRDGLLYRR